MSDEQKPLPEVDDIDLGLPTEAADSGETEDAEQPSEPTVIIPTENFEVDFDIPERYFASNPAPVTQEEIEEALVLPVVGQQTFNTLLEERLNNLSEVPPTKESAYWAKAMLDCTEGYPRDNAFQAAIDRDGAAWNTYLQGPDAPLGIINHGAGRITGGQPLGGIKAVAKAMSYTTAGSVIRVPLPLSGIWLTLKAPSDVALLELERQMSIDRGEYGRFTFGRVFSNSSVVLKSRLLALALECVVDSTYPDPNADLRTVIKMPDQELLIAYMALSIYPRGFPLVQPCPADPDICNHISKGKVNIAKMIRYDNSALSEKQRRFMARNQVRVNQAELTAYLEEFDQVFSSTYDYENIRFVFSTPTIAQFLEMGTEWVQSLETSVDEVFGAKLSVKERNDAINNAAKANGLRQYSHWVSKILYLEPNGEVASVVEDRDTIYNTLNIFSSDIKIAEAFYKAIGAYINSVTIAMVAVPSFTCPACKERAKVDEGRFRHLIPVDATMVFFTILSHRTGLIARREDI